MKEVARWFMVSLATAGGLGLLPVVPGTWGTLAGVAMHGVGRVFWESPRDERLFLVVLWVLIFSVSLLVVPWARRYWGEEDPRRFVLDEVLGYLVIPLLLDRSLPFWLLAGGGFVVFRIFDVVKLPGARWIDRQRGTLTVILDDVVSGVYGAAVLWVVARLFFPHGG